MKRWIDTKIQNLYLDFQKSLQGFEGKNEGSAFVIDIGTFKCDICK